MSKVVIVLMTASGLSYVWLEADSDKSITMSPAGALPVAEPFPLDLVEAERIDVRGRIVDEQGRPVPQAQVALMANGRVRGERGAATTRCCDRDRPTWRVISSWKSHPSSLTGSRNGIS